MLRHLVMALLLWGPTASAADRPVDDLVRAALAKEPMLAAASARAQRARAAASIGGAPMDPMISVTAMGRDPAMTSVDVMVSQTFAPPGANKAAKAVGNAQADAVDAEALGAALGLEGEVRVAAAMLAGARARLDALAMARANAVARIDAVGAQSSVGRTDNMALAMAEMTLGEVDGRLEAARADAEVARVMLVRLCGAAPDLELPPVPDAPPRAGSPPVLASMEAMRRMAEADAAMARAERLPDLTVSVGGAFRPPDMWGNMATLGVSTTLPVFGARKQGAKVTAAGLALSAAEADYLAMEADVAREQAELTATFQGLRRRVDAARKTAMSTRVAADSARSAYVVGMGDLDDLLVAEGKVVEVAEMDAMLRAEAIATHARLAAVSGTSLVAPESAGRERE